MFATVGHSWPQLVAVRHSSLQFVAARSSSPQVATVGNNLSQLFTLVHGWPRLFAFGPTWSQMALVVCVSHGRVISQLSLCSICHSLQTLPWDGDYTSTSEKRIVSKWFSLFSFFDRCWIACTVNPSTLWTGHSCRTIAINCKYDSFYGANRLTFS